MAKAPTKSVAKSQHIHAESFFKKNVLKIVVAVLSFLLYVNTVPNRYNLDDELVTINHRLTSGGIASIPDIFTSYYYEDNQGYKYEYRPIVLVSFAIEHSFFGDNPHVSHFINAVLYSLCCALLLVVLSMIFTGDLGVLAFIATLIFLAHPVHTEVVASIKNRDEIFALIFALLATYYALKYIEKGSMVHLLCIPLFFSFSLLSKPTAFSFSIVIPLILLFRYKPTLRYIYVVFSLIIPLFLLGPFSDFSQQVRVNLAICILFIVPYLLYSYGSRFYKSVFSLLARANKITGSRVVNVREQFKKNQLFSLPDYFFEGNPFKTAWDQCTKIQIAQIGIFFSLVIYSYYEYRPLAYGLSIILAVLTISSTRTKFFYFILSILNAKFLIHLIGVEDSLPLLIVVYTSLSLIFYRKKIDYRLAAPLLFVILLVSIVSFFPVLLIAIFFFSIRYSKIRMISLLVLAFYLFKVVCSASAVLQNTPNHIATLEFIEQVVCFIVFSTLYIFRNKPISTCCGWLTYMLPSAFIFFLCIGRYGYDSPSDAVEFFHYKNKIATSNDYSATIPSLVGRTPYSPLALLKSPGDTVNRPISFIEQPVGVNSPQAMRVGMAAEVLGKYLKLTFVPYPLSFYYGYREVDAININEPQAYIWAAIYILLLLAGLFLYWKKQASGLGILIYWICILPFCTYFVSIPGAMADRFLFIPTLGFAIVVADLFILASRSFFVDQPKTITGLPQGLNIILSIVLLVYGILTVQRNFEWKDKVTLYSNDIRHLQKSAQANNLTALAYMAHSYEITDTIEATDLRKKALVHFTAAANIYTFFNFNYDLGRVYSIFNVTDSALHYFQVAYNINPQTALPDLLMKLAILYQQKGMTDSSVAYYNKYINMNPQMLDGYINLSYEYYSKGNYLKAIEVCKMGETKIPNNSDLYYSIGQNFLAMNMGDSTLYYLYKAKEFNPNNVMINKSIADVAARFGKKNN